MFGLAETGRKAQTACGVPIFLQTPVSPSLGIIREQGFLGPILGGSELR